MAVRKNSGGKPRSKKTNNTKNLKTSRVSSLLKPASKRTLATILSVFVAALIVILLGILWYFKQYNNPSSVFWSMVNNNLATKSVTKNTFQTNSGINNTEVIQLSFNPAPLVRDIKDIKDSSTSPPTLLTLEGVGTPSADYQHYVKIDRPAAAGKTKSDYSKIYNMWLKSGDSTNAQLINSHLFGPMLFGNLSADQRKNIVGQLQNAYHIDFAAAKKESVNGRRIYSYNIKLSLKDYAIAARTYASIYNLPIAAQIDPAAYGENDTVDLVVRVDALSGQIKSLSYEANNLQEKYTSYGLVTNIQLPTKTVTSDEFQKAINTIK